MRSVFWMFIVLSLVLAGGVRAQEKPDAPQEPPATAPAGEVVDATEIEKLTEAEGRTVTARGKVSGTFTARSGRILINFEGADRDFTVMITKESSDTVNAGFDSDVTQAVDGKTIAVTGKVTLYRGKPQIEVAKPEQIKIEEEKN